MDNVHMIELENSKAGMVLSVDLLDGHGNILLPGKTILTAALISSLRRHQVTQIPVEAEVVDSPIDDQEQRRKLEKKIARIEQIFQTNDDQIINQQLKLYLINFLSAHPQ